LDGIRDSGHAPDLTFLFRATGAARDVLRLPGDTQSHTDQFMLKFRKICAGGRRIVRHRQRAELTCAKRRR
jgi:hypothetical protein